MPVVSFVPVTERVSSSSHTLLPVEWSLFADVPVEEVRRVLAVSRRRTFARGEVVCHRGDPADSLHLIRKGRFAVRITTPLGDTAILAVHGPGEAFGELALVSDASVRSATVAALEAGESHSIYRPDFLELRRKHPRVGDVLAALLADNVRRLSDHLVEALHLPAETRVLRRLLDAAAFYGGGKGEGGVPLTQEELAGLAGTSRATVNRVLREEARRGTVELARGNTRVLDRSAIARRAGDVAPSFPARNAVIAQPR